MLFEIPGDPLPLHDSLNKDEHTDVNSRQMKAQAHVKASRISVGPMPVRNNQPVIHEQSGESHAIEFACPSCHGPLESEDDKWRCRREDLRFGKEDGVTSFVLPDRRTSLEMFLNGYQKIRTLERWGSQSAEYYRNLPFHDLTGEYPDIWRIRARTFECFLRHFHSHWPTPAQVLDAGAGNCWLASRLAECGHSVVAMDVNLDPLDGLGAFHNVDSRLHGKILLVRAEFDHSPFGPESFDSIIFNASIHYSRDVTRTLRDSLILLREGGLLYILDTPIYHDEADGNKMLDERTRMFHTTYNVDIPPEFVGGFLTFSALDEMRETLKVECLTPDYGLSWRARPLIAALLGRRRPAAFRVIAIHKSDSAVRRIENFDRPEGT